MSMIRSELSWSTRERIVVRGKDLPGEILGTLTSATWPSSNSRAESECERIAHVQRHGR